MKQSLILSLAAVAAATTLVSCTPGERGALAGGAIGAGVGAAIGDGPGAHIGGAVGAVAGSEIAKNRARDRYYDDRRYYNNRGRYDHGRRPHRGYGY